MDVFQTPVSNLTPTLAEAATILDAAENPVAPDEEPETLLQTLAEIFAICRPQWATDYLFNSDASAALTTLTAPMSVSAAVSATFQTLCVEQRNSAPSFMGKIFDTTSTGEFVFVPDFSVGPISVGVGIARYFVVARDEWGLGLGLQPRKGELSHLRFIRDDARGTFMFTHEDKEKDILKFDWFQIVSPKYHKRRFLLVRRSPFLDLLRKQVIADLPSAMLANVMICFRTMDLRHCAKCSTSTDWDCKCETMPLLPEHPKDFMWTQENLRRHTGNFVGKSLATMYANGSPELDATCGSRIHVQGHANMELVRERVRWAIRDKMMFMPQEPMRFVLPTVRALVGPLDTVEEEQLMSGGSTPDMVATNSSGERMDAAGQGMGHDRPEESPCGSVKAILRMQRNRASAARSNKIRKERNDRLKKDLVDAHELETKLRAREQTLREENLLLKRRAMEVGKAATDVLLQGL